MDKLLFIVFVLAGTMFFINALMPDQESSPQVICVQAEPSSSSGEYGCLLGAIATIVCFIILMGMTQGHP